MKYKLYSTGSKSDGNRGREACLLLPLPPQHSNPKALLLSEGTSVCQEGSEDTWTRCPSWESPLPRGSNAEQAYM